MKFTVILRYVFSDSYSDSTDCETYIEWATVRGNDPDSVERAKDIVRKKAAKANGWTMEEVAQRMDTVAVFRGHHTPE